MHLRAGKVSGEVQHVLDVAMIILLHAVEADDDKVRLALDMQVLRLNKVGGVPNVAGQIWQVLSKHLALEDAYICSLQGCSDISFHPTGLGNTFCSCALQEAGSWSWQLRWPDEEPGDKALRGLPGEAHQPHFKKVSLINCP